MLNNRGRLEINFCRLLGQCNTVINGGHVDNWRLETYVQSLEDMLTEMKQSQSRPTDEELNQYSQQVAFLKAHLLTNALPSASERAMANQMVSPGPSYNSVGTKPNIIKEIQLKAKGRCTTEMRRELLAGDGLRSRATNQSVSSSTNEEYNTLLRYHQNKQEQIAEEMVQFARNLKENSRIAGAIVRKDTEMLEKSTKQADQNYDRLKVESNRLEQHTQRACSWWIWLMLLVVCSIFIMMIVFMKMFRKSS